MGGPLRYFSSRAQIPKAGGSGHLWSEGSDARFRQEPAVLAKRRSRPIREYANVLTIEGVDVFIVQMAVA